MRLSTHRVERLLSRRLFLLRHSQVAVVCDAAHSGPGRPLAQGADEAADDVADAGTRALVAFAVANLAQLPAARCLLVRRGALCAIAGWLRATQRGLTRFSLSS